MRAFSVLSLSLVAALALGCGDDDVQHLIENGDFETGDLTSWTISNGGSGTYRVTDDTLVASTPTEGGVLPPPQGTYAAISDMDNPGTHILYQDVDIPGGAQAAFRATIYLKNLHADYIIAPTAGLAFDGGESNQQFRIDAMDPAAAVDDVGAGVLLNIYQTQPGDSLVTGYRTVSADLSSLAGETVRIRFAQVQTQFFLHVGIDQVDVTAQ